MKEELSEDVKVLLNGLELNQAFLVKMMETACSLRDRVDPITPSQNDETFIYYILSGVVTVTGLKEGEICVVDTFKETQNFDVNLNMAQKRNYKVESQNTEEEGP